MALANELGLTNKVVSERHYIASQTNLTAGQAAKYISKSVNRKISAKDVRSLYKIYFKCEMEWHHSGFYQGETGKTMGTDQDIYGYLYPVKKGYESGTCFTRSVLGPLYLDYKPGDWLDYYVNTSGCADFYGSLCCTNTERSIMIDYSGLYPWLVRFPFLED